MRAVHWLQRQRRAQITPLEPSTADDHEQRRIAKEAGECDQHEAARKGIDTRCLPPWIT